MDVSVLSSRRHNYMSHHNKLKQFKHSVHHNKMGRDLLMGFQDVAFLPSRASFFTTFLKNCDRRESLWIITCLKIVVGVSKGMRTDPHTPLSYMQ